MKRDNNWLKDTVTKSNEVMTGLSQVSIAKDIKSELLQKATQIYVGAWCDKIDSNILTYILDSTVDIPAK